MAKSKPSQLTKKTTTPAKRTPVARKAVRKAVQSHNGTHPPAVKLPAAAKSPRTASGKKANPAMLKSAGEAAVAGTKERTEEGHLKAGRTPPSQETTGRQSGAT